MLPFKLQVYRVFNNVRHDSRYIELHNDQLLVYDQNSTTQAMALS